MIVFVETVFIESGKANNKKPLKMPLRAAA
jgi:hypothetical protein